MKRTSTSKFNSPPSPQQLPMPPYTDVFENSLTRSVSASIRPVILESAMRSGNTEKQSALCPHPMRIAPHIFALQSGPEVGFRPGPRALSAQYPKLAPWRTASQGFRARRQRIFTPNTCAVESQRTFREYWEVLQNLPAAGAPTYHLGTEFR